MLNPKCRYALSNNPLQDGDLCFRAPQQLSRGDRHLLPLPAFTIAAASSARSASSPFIYPSESISGRRLTNSDAGDPSEYPLVVSSVTTRRPPTQRYTCRRWKRSHISTNMVHTQYVQCACICTLRANTCTRSFLCAKN